MDRDQFFQRIMVQIGWHLHFQSRDLGWGMVLSGESIQQINDKRRGEAYFDREAAKAVSDCKLKKDLIESP